MNKWEWIGVTVINERRAKRKAATQTTTLLDQVTFTQPYGEIVSVIEDSETVRGTFQQLLLGEKTPSDGLILGYSETAVALRLSSLTLTQQTGKTYCQAYFRSRGFSKRVREARVKECEDFSELGPRFHTTINDYSVSEKAQLLTSLTLYSGAELLCLDDYVVWSTPSFLGKVMTRLTKLKEEGNSIWLFTDQLTKVGAYCDKVMWLQFGRLREVGRPKEVQDRYEAYLTSLHQMSLEEQQAYWAHGLASQRQEGEEASPKEEQLKEEDIIDAPIVEPLPLEDCQQEETEESSVTDSEESSDSPSRSQRHQTSHPFGKIRPSRGNQLGRRVAVGCLMLGMATGGGYLAARHYVLIDTDSSSLEAGPLVSSAKEEERESTEVTFPDMRRPETNENALETFTSVSNQPAPIASFTHSVQVGDSLSDLAMRYEVSVAELMAVNGLTDETIVAGETLSLPVTAKEGTKPSETTTEPVSSVATPVVANPSAPTVYQVVQGDTLFQIARRYGKSVLDLQQVNQLQTPDLVLGQELIIPD